MPKFCELPSELGDLIVNNLAADTRDILATSKVCRQLHAPAMRGLYAQISLNHNEPLDCCLLTRTLTEREDLALYVESVEVHWLENDEDFFNTVRWVLSLVTNLRRLCIDAPYRNLHSTTFSANFLYAQKYSRLEELDVDYEGLSLTEVHAFLRLPSLKSLKAYRICDPQPFLCTATCGGAEHALPLVIDLSRYRYSSNALRRLVSLRPKTLKSRCELSSCADRTIPDDIFADFTDADVSTPLSPRSWLRALKPVQDSLKKLQITCVDGPWKGHDGSRLSCRQFGRLTELEVSDLCFFPEKDPTPERDGVFELLPPSLVSLRIIFEDMHVGFLRRQARHIEDIDCHFAERSIYHWLEEIVNHKSAAFPSLSRVNILERPCGDTNVDWQTPVELKHLLLRYGVELKVLIRVVSDEMSV